MALMPSFTGKRMKNTIYPMAPIGSLPGAKPATRKEGEFSLGQVALEGQAGVTAIFLEGAAKTIILVEGLRV
jgi:hypothetical protein